MPNMRGIQQSVALSGVPFERSSPNCQTVARQKYLRGRGKKTGNG